jgi:hypothetical protein
MATLTLNNYAATPVNYQVLGIKEGVARWADVSQGTVGGYRTVSQEIRSPSDPTKQVTRLIWNIARPVVNATTGAVDYIQRSKIEIIQPPGCTLAERQECGAMTKNLAAHTFFTTAVNTQEGMY